MIYVYNLYLYDLKNMLPLHFCPSGLNPSLQKHCA